MSKFDYQTKMWGGSAVGLSPTYLGYLRLKYALSDLEGVSGTVLDAGCGGGGFTKAIKHHRPDLEVYGTDIAKESISLAKKGSQGVKFSVGDLYALPYKDKYFDAVIVEDVLEHLQRPDEALKEIWRVLKPGGILHAFVPLEGEPFTLHFWLEKFGWRAKERLAGHIKKFKLSVLLEMLRNQNLTVIKKRYSGHCLSQMVDVGYFTLLQITGKNLNTGLEQHIEQKTLVKSAKNLIAGIVNFESSLLYFFPASGVHFLCRKKG